MDRFLWGPTSSANVPGNCAHVIRPQSIKGGSPRAVLLTSSRNISARSLTNSYNGRIFLQLQFCRYHGPREHTRAFAADTRTLWQGQMLASFPPPELTPTILSTTLLPLMIPVVAMRNLRPADQKHDQHSEHGCRVHHQPLFCLATHRMAAISV